VLVDPATLDMLKVALPPEFTTPEIVPTRGFPYQYGPLPKVAWIPLPVPVNPTGLLGTAV
jgi:hypothetical protein